MNIEEAYRLATEVAMPDYGNAAHAVDSGEALWDADVEPTRRLRAAIHVCMEATLEEAGRLVKALSPDTSIDGWARLHYRIAALGIEGE